MYSQDIFSKTDDILGIGWSPSGIWHHGVFVMGLANINSSSFLNRWECYLHRPQCCHCTKAIDVDDNTKLPTYGMRDIFYEKQKAWYRC